MASNQIQDNTLTVTKGFSRKELTLSHQNCGSCAGLYREDLLDHGMDKDSKPPKKQTCASMGHTAGAEACPKFKPDVFALNEIFDDPDANRKVMEVLGAMLGSLPKSKLRLASGIFLYEEITRKHGYQFYQKVFVRYRGTANQNYLSNFLAARVVWADKNFINLVSCQKGKNPFTLTIPYNDSDSNVIYTEEQFKPLRKKMKAKKRFVDPVEKRNALRAVLPDGEVNLNAIPNELRETQFKDGTVVADLDQVAKANKVKKSKANTGKPYDLVQQANDLLRGHIVKPTKAQNFGKRRKTKSGEIELSSL